MWGPGALQLLASGRQRSLRKLLHHVPGALYEDTVSTRLFYRCRYRRRRVRVCMYVCMYICMYNCSYMYRQLLRTLQDPVHSLTCYSNT